MDDERIVALFWQRSETALMEAQNRYGRLLAGIAGRFLASREDCEETVNDALLRAWNAIPPERPQHLAGYLAKITRRLCVDRLRKNGAAKRGGDAYALSLDELADCVPGDGDPAQPAELDDLTGAIDRFLETVDPVKRTVFLQRYFHAMTIAEIAAKNGLTQSSVKVTLSRLRAKLKEHLTREGFA